MAVASYNLYNSLKLMVCVSQRTNSKQRCENGAASQQNLKTWTRQTYLVSDHGHNFS